MATTVTFNGSSYSIPANREPRGWGTSLSSFLVDVANSSLSKAGGVFTLTADANFGTSYGLVSKYIKYSAGQLTMNTSGTLTLPNATDTLVGKDTTDILTNKTLTSPVINTPTGIVKGDVGLGNVDNTSDANKPISTATQTALDLKAPIASPTFTGTVSGITSTMVGLGNVDNTSNATERAASVTLTNKTITDPIIDDGLRLNHETSVTTPASGKLAVFAKNDDKLYMTNSSGITTAVASSGTGEKNYVTNPSAASATTGWANVGDLDITRTTTAAELPREYTTATGFKVSADANTQSVADYVYFDFTLDDIDLSKKLKIEWSQKLLGAYTAGQLAVVITTQADRTTALHTPATTAIPAADGVFTTSFDSSTTATLSLVIRATGDMTTDTGIVISDVVVGPGTITQGAAVSETTSYTPVAGGLGSGSMTCTGFWERVGSYMHISMGFTKVSAGSGASAWTMSIPSGYTIDASRLNTGSVSASQNNQVGVMLNYGLLTAAQYKNSIGCFPTSTTTISFSEPGAGTQITGADLLDGGAGSINIRIPIAEWAGNGTVNLGAGAQVEYAYNSNTTYSTTSDSSNFAYGPSGTTLPSSALGANATRNVQFQYPIQQDDIISVEISIDRTSWVSIGESSTGVTGWIGGTATDYGIGWTQVSSSQIQVLISRYRRPAGTWDAAGADWTGTRYWRVRKAKASSPVGFGLAGTDGSSGLYKAGQAPGLTTGAAIPAGYVGETLGTLRSGTNGFTYSTRTTTSPTTSYASLVSVTLNKGTYLIYGNSNCALSVAGILYGYLAVGGTQVTNAISTSAAVGYDMAMAVSAPITISADGTAVAVFGKLNVTTGLVVIGHELFAVRIA